MNETASLFSLSGKTALLTGATGHLGREMAFALAEAGARVLVNGRNLERCISLVETLTRHGYKAEAHAFDVTCHQEVQAFYSSLMGAPVDILINNAFSGSAGTIETAVDEEFLLSYEQSVVSTHRLLREGLPNLRTAVQQGGYASIINISSMYGIVSPDLRNYSSHKAANPPSYGAAKAALLQFTRYAACEFGPEGIRVNAIAPGPFPSEEVQTNEPHFVNRLTERVPLGRVGRSREIRGPLIFLASPASSFVNAATIVVDGGWTSW